MDLQEKFKNISNIGTNINNIDEYLTNLAKQKAQPNKIKNNYFKYNIDKVLKTNFHDINIPEKSHINICCFKIVESTKYSQILYPYLQYLLFKYPESKKKESDLCLFPFLEFKKKMNILNEAKKMIKNIFKKQYNCLGYLIDNDELFLFYNIDSDVRNKYLIKKDNKFWWCLIDEICNHRKLLNFNIHESTTNLFLKYPDLIFLKNKQKENIEVPKVVYKGDNFNLMPYLFIIGQKSATNALFGPFYYFTNYFESFRRGAWSTNYKMVKMNNKLITDENGKYKRGGIIRYLVYFSKQRVVLNTKNDLFKKSVLNDINDPTSFKQRKNIGKWAKSYDSLFANKVKIDKDTYFNHHPFYIIKNLENIRALSIHEIDMSTVKTNWDPLYTKYNIL
tara:strand:+ start:9071 stop:10246 length:1176 start_codon:yes stop_codon:yes gene_type:complete